MAAYAESASLIIITYCVKISLICNSACRSLEVLLAMLLKVESSVHEDGKLRLPCYTTAREQARARQRPQRAECQLSAVVKLVR